MSGTSKNGTDFPGFYDTGEWKLSIFISKTEFSAKLSHIDADDKRAYTVVNEQWEDGEIESVLPRIETIIYNNPRLLDDFATNITIQTEKALWIPTELTEDENYKEDFFSSVYDVKPEDIFFDYGEEISCLYYLAPGVKSFLNRTLPGCKIACSLATYKTMTDKSEALRLTHSELPASIYVKIYPSHSALTAYHDGNFLSGAFHPRENLDDIIYRILLSARAYGLTHKSIFLTLYSQDSSALKIAEQLSEHFGKVECYAVRL